MLKASLHLQARHLNPLLVPLRDSLMFLPAIIRASESGASLRRDRTYVRLLWFNNIKLQQSTLAHFRKLEIC